MYPEKESEDRLVPAVVIRVTAKEVNNTLDRWDVASVLPNGALQSYRLSYLAPASVFLPLQAPEVGRCRREIAVVQEPTNILDRLSGVTPQFCCRVPKDVHPG